MESSLRSRRAPSRPAPSRWRVRLLDVTIIIAALLVCVFVFSFSTRLSYSRSPARETPVVVRVQVLNGSGRPGLARQVADHLAQLQVGRMRFDLIDVGNSDRTDIRKSFVVNRHLEEEQLRAIIAALGIGDVQISEGAGRTNDLGVDLTVVLGANAVAPPAAARP